MKAAALRSPQQGLALVAVMWLVAALSLMAASMTYTMRAEVRVVSTLRDMAAASALGDAVIQLAAAQLVTPGAIRDQYRQFELDFERRRFEVRVVPLTGLIDLNAAPAALLGDLLATAGGLDADAATILAQRIVDWRDKDDAALPSGAENDAYVAANSLFRTRGEGFEATEDLLQVLGMDVDLYGKISPLVTADGGADKVDPMAAPLPVLLVLAGANAQVAERVFVARATDGKLADTSGLSPAHTGQSAASRYRIEARVPLPSGVIMVRTQVVDASPSQAQRVPWRLVHAGRSLEQPQVAPSPSQ